MRFNDLLPQLLTKKPGADGKTRISVKEAEEAKAKQGSKPISIKMDGKTPLNPFTVMSKMVGVSKPAPHVKIETVTNEVIKMRTKKARVAKKAERQVK